MTKLIIPGETQPGTLIVPGNEPVKPFFKPNRRGFIGVLAGAFTGAVVAPMIVPYASLMKIDSPTNRLIFAYRTYQGGKYTKSFLNLGECLDPFVRAQWEGQFPLNMYDLVREAEIPVEREYRYGLWDYVVTRYHDGVAVRTVDRDSLEQSRRRLKARVAAFRSGQTTYI